MSSLKFTLVAILASGIVAAPLFTSPEGHVNAPRQIFGGQVCYDRLFYHITDTKDEPGESRFAAGYCSPSGGDCSTTHSETFTIGTTVTVGGGLGLDLSGIFSSAHVDASYSVSKLSGRSDSAGASCGKSNSQGKWTCGLLITPSGKKVKGYQYSAKPDICGGKPSDDPGHGDDYEVWYPKKTTDNLPIFDVKACTCPNKPHADDDGAPEKCPKDCDDNATA